MGFNLSLLAPVRSSAARPAHRELRPTEELTPSPSTSPYVGGFTHECADDFTIAFAGKSPQLQAC
ncbi:hypothetical protein, partial [Pseudomonas sp. 51_B]|uniref:hypothetical protein n=1 Tax=Pseudomonas sp. 51_B TaxID=2813573 RepID=UPI001A9D083A